MKLFFPFLPFLFVFVILIFLIVFLFSEPKSKSNDKSNIKIKLFREALEQITKKIEEREKERRIRKSEIPVYYINMDKHIDRHRFMSNQLEKYFYRYNRVSGFNGYLIENPENDTVNGITFFNKYYLSKGEIGCVLSHLNAIKTSYENNDLYSIILEDDTMVHLLSLDIDLEKIMSDAPLDWEIIQLFCIKNTKQELNHLPLTLNTGKFSYYRHQPTHYSFSTVGYIINRKGMEKILRQSYLGRNVFYLGPNKQNMPKYGAADFFLYDLTVTYILYPNVFYVNNINLKSTIENHDLHNDSHTQSALNVLQYYNNTDVDDK